MAYQGHIIIPTAKAGVDEVIDSVATKMAVKFGGYSREDGFGGYNTGEQIVEEDHTHLVATANDMPKEQLKEFLRIEAKYVKESLNEDEVLIEVQETEMELV